jgi:hypothetical protein
MAEPSPIQYVTVVCRTCGTRIDERQAGEPRMVACPMCHEPAEIPALNSKPKALPRPKDDVETYRVIGANDHDGEARLKKAADVIVVICPICQARLHPTPRSKPTQVRCPDCHEPVRVPSRTEAADKQRRDAIPKPQFEGASLPVSVPTKKAREYSRWFLHAQGHIRREKVSKPPKSLFFSNVWTIAWQREVLSRWAYLSLGLTSCLAIVYAMLSVFAGAVGYGGIVLAFFALPLIWIILWTFSYAAAVWLVILIDTANGSRRITGWGEQNWREWIFQLVYVEYLFAIAAAVSHGVGMAAQYAGGSYWMAFIPSAALLFHLLVLSSLERGGTWNIFSLNILASLVRKPHLWGAFFILAGSVTVAWGALTLWLIPRALPLLILFGGLVTSAVTLIHARLLGRLAYGLSRE